MTTGVIDMNEEKLIVAIHQPNFFPWLGYFSKIVRADRFVFLDNVQIPRTGAGSWVNRVRLWIGGAAKWFTMPIDKSSEGLRSIAETRIAANDYVRRKMVATLQHSYGKAPFFDDVFPLIASLVNNPEANLAEYNMHAILKLSTVLGLDADKFMRASRLANDGEVSTDRLIRLTREVGGTVYLYGAVAAQAYQENEKFQRGNLALLAQSFVHPIYPQFNTSGFVPGLSIIDALMNVGVGGVRDLLCASRDKGLTEKAQKICNEELQGS